MSDAMNVLPPSVAFIRYDASGTIVGWGFMAQNLVQAEIDGGALTLMGDASWPPVGTLAFTHTVDPAAKVLVKRPS